MTHKPRSWQLDQMIAAEMPDFLKSGCEFAEDYDSGIEIRVTVASSKRDQSGGRQVHTARSAIAAECMLYNLTRARNLWYVNPNGSLTKIHLR